VTVTADALKDKEDIPELIGKVMPAAYIMNYESYGYGMFALDEKSI
jgi:hypothetical protein